MKKFKNLLSLTLALVISLMTFAFPANAATTTAVGGAYSIGGEFHNGQDVIQAADMWALCGYRSFYNIDPDYAYLNSDRLDSYVVYFSAHGGQDAIYLLNDLVLSDGYVPSTSTTVNIRNFSLSRTKLYVYDACYTASSLDGTSINLCTETVRAGADCVIGWTEAIYASDALDWQERFQDQLACGATVLAAANYANRFTYYDNTSIKSWRIYGNSSMVIKLSTASATTKLNVEEENEHVFFDLSTYRTDCVVTASNPVEKILKVVDANFDKNAYTVECTYTNDEKSNYVLDYTYTINGYYSNVGYSVLVEDGKVVGVQSNFGSATVTENKKVAPVVSQDVIDRAFAEANATVAARPDNSTVVEQTGEVLYDATRGGYVYCVKTVYQIEAGGFGAFTTVVEL